MKIENVILKLVDLQHRTGKAKETGNAYDFYTIIVVDEDYNRFQSTLNRDDLANLAAITTYAEEKEDIICDLIMTPDEYMVKLRIENIRSK